MWIIHGKIFTMAGTYYEDGYVEICEGKIAKVGSMEQLNLELPRPERQTDGTHMSEAKILDVQGAWVLPGLIEAHAHIGLSEEKSGAIGDDCNEQTDPICSALRGLDGVNPLDPAFHDAISAGITSVMTGPGSANVVGGQFVFLKTHGRCVDEMVLKQPAAMKAALGENPKVTYGEKDRCPGTRMGNAYLLRKTLFQAREYLRKKEQAEQAQQLERTYQTEQSGRIKEARQEKQVAPEPDFDLEPWIPVLKKEIPLKIHAHRADDIFTAIRIAKEFDVELTIDHCTEGHLISDKIAESGFPVIVGTDLTSRSKLEVEYMSFKTAGILAKAGVKVAVTTDHPVALIQYLPLCAGFSVKYGLPFEEGLKSITINPAQICRVEHRIGSLEPGKDADIAIFDGNPMEVFTHTLYTIIDGKVIYDGKTQRNIRGGSYENE